MSVYGYIFLEDDQQLPVPMAEQVRVVAEFARTVGLAVDRNVLEIGVSLKKPFKDRPEGSGLLQLCRPNDVIVVQKAEWVLSSAAEGASFLRGLRKKGIALYCVDLDGNISIDEPRKLMVYQGPAVIVQKLLDSLAVCESSKHGEAIRATKRNLKREGKYLGGPVPFGWQVNAAGFLEEKPDQQEIIEAIIAMRNDRWSYRDISRKLEEEHGIRLSHEGVRRVLENDRKKKSAQPLRNETAKQ
jgi:DNA invertase Pin-like site-specific DNA recombinase